MFRTAQSVVREIAGAALTQGANAASRTGFAAQRCCHNSGKRSLLFHVAQHGDTTEGFIHVETAAPPQTPQMRDEALHR